jgi:hypothetical protein
MAEWKVCLWDKYPAYIGWDTFERIQGMIRDNHSEYDRNKSRGVPRPGKALLHGIVSCGECGHKMVVQYKGGPRYLCNYLRQQYRVPVCQNLPADPIDAHVVQAFLDALSPAELDLYGQAVAALSREREQVLQAQRQQIERLRYQAHLAERQYNQTDPDNRLVAAELERRWEAALRDLQDAEERFRHEQEPPRVPEKLSAEERQAFLQAGKTIPELWSQDRLTPQQKKAFLRSFIDKVVVHRSAPDTLHVRIVWRGGDTTTTLLPVTVGSLARLSSAAAMENEVLELAHQGQTDEEIAAALTRRGYRSPKHAAVLPSTVRILRLRHRLLRDRSQSHPRQIPGYLTVSQIARSLGIKAHWIYDRIHNGTIQIAINSKTGLYLFPDRPKTMTRFQQLRAGELQKLRF